MDAMRPTAWRVSATAAGQRLAKFLQVHLGDRISGKGIKRAIERGACRVNGRRETFASRRLAEGDEVCYTSLPLAEGGVRLEIDERGVLYEDDALLVYDKPAGFACQPMAGGGRPDLFTALRQWSACRGGGGAGHLAMVHRLDRDTSGAILFCKRAEIEAPLSAAFRERRVEKLYVALVDGVLAAGAGEIRRALERVPGKGPGEPARWREAPGAGLEAVTGFEVIERFACATYLRAFPRTGRTHQIRVHLAARGHPLLGDMVYGTHFRCPLLAERHLLHARRLAFEHPVSGARITVEAPVPEDFRAALAQLRRDAERPAWPARP